MHDEDARDLTKHAARERLMEQYRLTFGLSRKGANEEWMAHIENDDDAPVAPQLAPRRKRRARAEVHA